MTNHICEVKDCKEESKYITTTESKMIEICKQHWNEKYKS